MKKHILFISCDDIEKIRVIVNMIMTDNDIEWKECHVLDDQDLR